MNPLVSIIIPTYNRFKVLLKTIESVKNQTYKNIEIIVVNDCSTEKEYYSHNWNGVKIIHLPENSRKKFPYPCAAYVRDMGVKESKGELIAFLDDDDYWLPKKLERQVKMMKDYDICCTEALCGRGSYEEKMDTKMLQEYHYNYIKEKLLKNGIDISNGYPKKWGEKLINIHNCVITSSVLMKKSLIDKYGMMPYLKNGKEDYTYWKRILKENTCFFIETPCLYYDMGHAGGRNY